MKRDIRDLFKENEDLRYLPKQHREDFIQKLKSNSKKKKIDTFWLKIAAVIIIAITVGFSIFYTQPNESQASKLIAQIDEVEKTYLKDIETEWQSFKKIANDEHLVMRFEKKLDELDADYQVISFQFKKDTSNIIIIEALIENLQTRLELLKNIQRHIKILNQKNEPNETTI